MTKEVININGWKGKDQIEIHEGVDYYLVVEHRKEKQTGEVKKSEYKVFKGDVKRIWDIIKEKCDLQQKYGYRFIIRKWIEKNKINGKTIFLHKRIWEEHYNKKVPKGYTIHHLDGNPSNNNILNLVLMKWNIHVAYHNLAKSIGTYPLEFKFKIKRGTMKLDGGRGKITKISNERLI